MMHHAAPCCTMLHHAAPCCTMLHHAADIDAGEQRIPPAQRNSGQTHITVCQRGHHPFISPGDHNLRNLPKKKSSVHGNVVPKISTRLFQMPYNGPASEISALALPALNMVAEMATNATDEGATNLQKPNIIVNRHNHVKSKVCI
jgi:hypothetical protein